MIIVGAFMFGIVLTENIKLRKEMQVANQSIKALRTIESIKNIEP
jgi:Kef-type K+ transport system membrane component KefB